MAEQKDTLILKKATTHIGVWLLLVVLPFLLSATDSLDYLKITRVSLIPHLFHAIIFYTNYFFLTDKFLFDKKRGIYFLVNAALITISVYCVFEVRAYIDTFIPQVIRPKGNNAYSTEFIIYRDIISMIIPVTISAAVGIAERWSRDEDEKREREKEMLNTELQHLKYQLQPHFFFNSLNTVYALIENSPTLAQETVHNLASLMRYMLYETDQRNVKLSSEVRFMIQYIALMKLRISPRTKITTNFQALGDNYEIVPLLFISLIENAFKHGVSATQPSDIFFKLSVSDDKVCFYAENTNFPKTADDKSGKGIGLINLQKRLQLSYPDKYQFNTWVKDNLFCAQLEITITKKKSGNTATVANEENKLHYS